MLKWLAACLGICFFAGAPAAPTTGAPEAVPPALKEWRGWALKDLEYRACPFLAGSSARSPGDFVCAWPGRLAVSSGADGATFAVRWRVEAPSWIALPGDTGHWPQQVAVNGLRQPVLPHEGRPSLRLDPGTYELSGRIPWRERPQRLAVPPSIGLIDLTVDGKAVAPVQRDGDMLVLGRAAASAPQADSLDLRVYRKLADGVPAVLTTRILFSVSGQAREETIGPALPAGFAPSALTSNWPARLDGDGRLHVQVQPGSETLVLSARATAPLTEVTAQVPATPWAKQEVWSYEAAPRLRVTVARGAIQLDPRQADVPSQWQALPAFALADGGKLTIEQRSRGLAPDEANRITLQREAWLDFSGAGWYAHDHLSGTMATGWRFDVAAPFALEQATAQNSGRVPGGEPLLITDGAKQGWSGVEWRSPRVDLAAGVRVAEAASMPVAGWQQTFDSVRATLHFPFGYKLIAAPGADAAAGSWASDWSLLDAFVCAIAVLLAWRLLGLAGALAAAAFLLLAYQESGAPLWSLIAAFGLTLVARALPEGRLGRWAEWLRRAALLALLVVALPFAAGQLRDALYPQLERGFAAAYDAAAAGATAPAAQPKAKASVHLNDGLRRGRPTAAPAPPAEAESATPMPSPPAAARLQITERARVPSRKTIVSTASTIQRSALVDHYGETTAVQTGSGAPDWSLGSTAQLSWSGPVLASQSVHLLIARPWLVRPLRVVLTLLLAWLVWHVFRAGGAGRPARGAGAGGAAALLLVGIFTAPTAQAQGYPPGDLLQQLRQRLSEAPKCAPACASLAQAQVGASGDEVKVALEADAGARVALPLPNDPAAASLQSVRVDGVAVDGVERDTAGRLWIATDRGVHRIELDFRVTGDKIALAFPLRPARVLFQGKGWQASGLSDERLLTETLTLARAAAVQSHAAAGAGMQQFPPYVRVVRSLSLGLEWTASTTIRRLSPAQGGFTVDVPVMSGEHVATGGIKVVDGKAQVAIADGEAVAGWHSTLDKSDSLTLTAPALTARAEVWSVIVSPTWHVAFSGVPEVGFDHGGDPNDYHSFEFHPLPGERLTLRVTRPAVVQGALRAIDAVDLVTRAGRRAATHVLRFTLRASQGGEQALTLPKNADVLGASRNGAALNLRALDGRISLPVSPGTQRYEIRLRSPDAIGFRAGTPEISLGLPAANVGVSLQLPEDRWLLATWGPPAGPAVLYWGELIVMIAIAWALVRTRRTGLKFRDWLLLGLGFSTFSWVALLVVVAWLFAFDWRGRAAMPGPRWQFNLLQIGLVALTAIALVGLVSAIPQGLLGQPDMHVAGNGSSAHWLRWFVDRSAGALPRASAISLPLWVYKLLMLAWAIWLANALIGWLRDGFGAWTSGGYWRARPKAPAGAEPVESAPNGP